MATLVYSEAGGDSTRYQLRGKSILIGGSAECAIRSGDPLVAPQHARLYEQSGEYWIEDLGSDSGVFVGDKRVAKSRIPFGQVVVVGNLMLRIDDGNGGSQTTPILATELVKMLAASGERQKQLEEERNALGARVGELHQELAAAKSAVEADKQAEATVPSEGFDSTGLEKLAGELRAAEKARRDLEAKINRAQRKRAATQNDLLAAEADDDAGDVAEAEIKQVQMLALNAQLAEADKSVERLRGQLRTRNQEIAALRERARKQTNSDVEAPRTTQPYAVPRLDDEPDAKSGKKLAELKAQFDAEFSRAVTFQTKLKTAESRLAEAEKLAESRLAEAEKLAAKANEADELRERVTELESAVEEAKKSAAEAGSEGEELDKQKKKVGDLKKLLEGAQREISGLRGKLTAAKEEASKAAARSEALESELGDSAAKVIEQAEKLVSIGAELEDKAAAVATKDRELTEMAAAVAISAEKNEEREKLEKQLAALETELGQVRSTIKKNEESRDAALAAKRELEARVIGAKSEADESRAKLSHAERRVSEIQSARERAEEALEAAKNDLVEAREARLAAEEALVDKGASPNRDNTAVISLKRRISENQEEAATEIDRLTDRLREVETDLDRALDAERAALARADAEGAAVSAQIDRLTEERDKQSEERARASSERDALLSERNQLRGERNRLRAERDGLSKQLEEHAAKVTKLEQAQQAAASQAEQAPGSAAELRERVIELASQNAKLSSDLSALEETGLEAVARIAELEEQLTKATSELDQTTTARGELKSANRGLVAANEDLTRRYEQISARLIATESVDMTTQDREADELLRECQALRERVAVLEAQVEVESETTNGRVDTLNDIEDPADDATATSPSGELIEWMNNLHEAISDLRKEMRAASDEAAVLPGDSESVDVINDALSTAVARVEAARDALARIAALVGLA